MASVMTSPRHCGHDHTMLTAPHPWRIRLQHRLHRSQIQCPPPATTRTTVITRTATSAYPTPAPLPARRPHMRDQQVRILLELEPLDHRLLDTQQVPP